MTHLWPITGNDQINKIEKRHEIWQTRFKKIENEKSYRAFMLHMFGFIEPFTNYLQN